MSPLDSPLASATKLVAVDTALDGAVDAAAFVVAEALVVAVAEAEPLLAAVSCHPSLGCPRWRGQPPILLWQL